MKWKLTIGATDSDEAAGVCAYDDDGLRVGAWDGCVGRQLRVDWPLEAHPRC